MRAVVRIEDDAVRGVDGVRQTGGVKVRPEVDDLAGGDVVGRGELRRLLGRRQAVVQREAVVGRVDQGARAMG